MSGDMLAAADRLRNYYSGNEKSADNPGGMTGPDGMAANWDACIRDIGTVGEGVGEAAAAVEALKEAAAGSASAAATDRAAVATDKAAVHTDRLAADADALATAADRIAVATDKAAVHTDRLAADADALATAADRTAVATDKVAVHTDRLAADADALTTAADRLAVAADAAAAHTDRLAADAAKAAAQAAAAGLNLPSVTVSDAGKTLVVKPDGTGYQVGAAGSSISQSGPVLCASGGTMTVTGQAVLAVQEQITGQTFNIGYTAEVDYVQENAATGTDAAGGAFTLANSAGAVIDANTKLLIHADGANGSTEIVDERGITLFGTSCAYFDGASYWKVPASYKTAFGTTQVFTYEMWVRPIGGSFILDASNSSTGANGVRLSYSSGTSKFTFYDGANGSTVPTNTSAADTWHHVAIVRSGGTRKYYVNGVLEGSSADTSDIQPFAISLGIRGDLNSSTYFIGHIDQFRVSKVARYTGAFTPPTAAFTTDADTVYLFQFDDGHGSQFIRDASQSGHEISCVNNDASISATRAKFGSTSLGLPGTNNARVFVAQGKPHSDFTVGSDAFTIDGQFYLTNAAATRTLFHTGQESEKGLRLEVHSDGHLYLYAASSNSAYDLANGVDCGAFPLNQWNHVAVTRSGTSLYVFVGGTVGATVSVSTSSIYTGTTYALTIGGLQSSAGNLWVGNVDEFRFKRGQAAWTSSFTTPTNPHTADDYTALLLHFDGANGDKVTLDSSESSYGNNGFGDTTTPILTFAGSATLSTAQTRGGNSTSLALNGSSQYASVQFAAPGAGHPLYFAPWEHLCIEGWFYLSSTSAAYELVEIISASATAGNRFELATASGGVPTIYINSGSVASGPALTTGWNHVAAVREPRGWAVYTNGVAGSAAQPQTNIGYASDAYVLYLGADRGSTGYLSGAIDSFRITHGKPRYTANFTPGNLTQDADTTLLWVFSGASGQKWVKELSKNTALIPATGARTVRGGRFITPTLTGANATISTAQSKFGGGSLSHNGTTSNYFSIPHNADFAPQGDYTIECWLRPNSTGNNKKILTKNGSTVATSSFSLLVDSSGKVGFDHYTGSTTNNVISTTVLSTSTFTHVAVTLSGTTLRLFVNGTQEASATVAGVMNVAATANVVLGANYDGTGPYSGYIDELRLSNTARWTANFTPPTLPYGQQYATGPCWVATKPGISSLDLSAFSSIDNAAFTGAEPATTTLRFLISTDGYAGPLKVWNGSAWVSSGYSMSWNAGAGTLTTAATAAQLTAAGNSWTQLAAGLVALDVSAITSLNIVAVLATTNQSYTPTLDAITLTMDEYVLLQPVADYTVRRKKAAGSQTLTITRVKAGAAYHAIDYVAG